MTLANKGTQLGTGIASTTSAILTWRSLKYQFACIEGHNDNQHKIEAIAHCLQHIRCDWVDRGAKHHTQIGLLNR